MLLLRVLIQLLLLLLLLSVVCCLSGRQKLFVKERYILWRFSFVQMRTGDVDKSKNSRLFVVFTSRSQIWNIRRCIQISRRLEIEWIPVEFIWINSNRRRWWNSNIVVMIIYFINIYLFILLYIVYSDNWLSRNVTAHSVTKSLWLKQHLNEFESIKINVLIKLVIDWESDSGNDRISLFRKRKKND